jgi:hypothetical protein
MGRRRGNAAHRGELGEGRGGRFHLQEDDHESTPEELTSVLQGSDDLTFLGQEMGGVRFLGMLGVLAGRENGKRGSRMSWLLLVISADPEVGFSFPRLVPSHEMRLCALGA